MYNVERVPSERCVKIRRAKLKVRKVKCAQRRMKVKVCAVEGV